MKVLPGFFSIASIAALLLAGCASERHIVLAPVGPPPAALVQGLEGSLVVYSAAGRNARFSSPPYRVVYSDYELRSRDGKFLQSIHNDTESFAGGPKHVALSAGEYQVFARANGYGYVTVPIVIRPHQTTTVHLAGGGWTSDSPAPSDSIRLPGGEVVGWNADARLTGPPATGSAR
jgi:hypothetical protein